MRTLLVLAPFPLGAGASFGGDARAIANRRLFEALGCDVHAIGVYPAAAVPEAARGEGDLVLDDLALAAAYHDDMAFAGLHLARAAALDSVARERLRRSIAAVGPDAVMVEHPWPWPLLQAVLPELSARPRLVYASHNIEADLRPILYPYCAVAPGAEARRQAVSALEASAAREADLVLAISAGDARVMAERWDVAAVVLPPTSALETVAYDDPPSTRPPYAAFSASAFWPNVEGFFAVFSEGLGFLRQDELMAVAGSAADAIAGDRRFADFASVNRSRFRGLGLLSSPELARFLRGAACVVLPVHEGTGANMKTADAFWSGRPVVCTSKALVGYERALPFVGAGVYVADDAPTFRRLVRAGIRGELEPPPATLAAGAAPEAMAILAGALDRFTDWRSGG